MDAVRRLLQFAQDQGFAGLQDEMSFFKTMKPQLEGKLLFYIRQLQIMLGKPSGSKESLQRYYHTQLESINRFFEENRFLVRYYRSGETFLDDRLFVRVDALAFLTAGDMLQAGDLHAMYDRFAAELVANELLAGYLAGAVTALDDMPLPDFGGNNTALKWTDSKAALVELLYALYRKGSINNGQAGIKEIAGFLEKAFGVDLGNYYRAFQELRIRKTGRTNYLDHLKSGLIKYMDDTDLNYKG